jgi:hypothetical protein
LKSFEESWERYNFRVFQDMTPGAIMGRHAGNTARSFAALFPVHRV